jgi:hypothetical protein
LKNSLVFLIVHELLQLEYSVVGRSGDHEWHGIALDEAPKFMIATISFMGGRDAQRDRPGRSNRGAFGHDGPLQGEIAKMIKPERDGLLISEYNKAVVRF